ncbi:MAG: hypothetical protein ABIM88_02200 [candidate division WOR-3 bacterium]
MMAILLSIVFEDSLAGVRLSLPPGWVQTGVMISSSQIGAVVTKRPFQRVSFYWGIEKSMTLEMMVQAFTASVKGEFPDASVLEDTTFFLGDFKARSVVMAAEAGGVRCENALLAVKAGALYFKALFRLEPGARFSDASSVYREFVQGLSLEKVENPKISLGEVRFSNERVEVDLSSAPRWLMCFTEPGGLVPATLYALPEEWGFSLAVMIPYKGTKRVDAIVASWEGNEGSAEALEKALKRTQDAEEFGLEGTAELSGKSRFRFWFKHKTKMKGVMKKYGVADVRSEGGICWVSAVFSSHEMDEEYTSLAVEFLNAVRFK